MRALCVSLQITDYSFIFARGYVNEKWKKKNNYYIINNIIYILYYLLTPNGFMIGGRYFKTVICNL